MVGLVLAAALGDNDVGHHARQDQGQSGKQEEVVVGQQKAVGRKQANAVATEISPADWMIFFFMSAKLQQIIWLIKKKSVLLHRILMESL